MRFSDTGAGPGSCGRMPLASNGNMAGQMKLQIRAAAAVLSLLAVPASFPGLVEAQAVSNSAKRLVEAVQQQDVGLVRALLADGRLVDAPQADGTTPLAWAVHRDDLVLANLLIAAGASVDIANDLGITPLMLAGANGSAPMVASLLQAGADSALARSTGESALMVAARTGNVGAVRTLVAYGADPNAATTAGETALMWAAVEGHVRVVAMLAEVGADVHARTGVLIRPGRGRTADRPAPRILSRFEAVNPAALPRDGDRDPPRPEGGFTPLLYAVLAGDFDSVSVLLEAGANVNEAGPDGVTAVMLALIKRHKEIALLLLERGADPQSSEAGYSALHLASATGSLGVAEALLAGGADPNLRLERPQRLTNAFEIGVFQSPGSGRLTQIGSTPFMVAAKSADVQMMRLLARSGADPLLTADDGTTALMLAAGLGKRAATDITYYSWTEEQAVAALQIGLGFGIDINAVNEHGETALHAAAYHNAQQVIDFLVESDAEINATNAADQTALRIAEGHLICCTTFVRHLEAADRLRKLGADPAVGTQLTFGLTAFGDPSGQGETR